MTTIEYVTVSVDWQTLKLVETSQVGIPSAALCFVPVSCSPKIENKQFCVIYSCFLHVCERKEKSRYDRNTVYRWNT